MGENNYSSSKQSLLGKLYLIISYSITDMSGTIMYLVLTYCSRNRSINATVLHMALIALQTNQNCILLHNIATK